MADLGIAHGTVEAHGRTWPWYEREAFSVEVSGYLEFDLSDGQRELLEQSLQKLLKPHGVGVKLQRVMRHVMSPEDRAEKHRLDDLVTAGLSHLIS